MDQGAQTRGPLHLSDVLGGDPRWAASMSRARFTAAEPEPVERERPEIRNVADFWCWLNTWGDLEAHDYATSGEREAYRRCIFDAMAALGRAGVVYSDATEAWKRWEGL